MHWLLLVWLHTMLLQSKPNEFSEDADKRESVIDEIMIKKEETKEQLALICCLAAYNKEFPDKNSA